MIFKIGDGSTAIHWRKNQDGKFFLDFRLTPRRNVIGSDSNENSDPDLSIEIGNSQSAGVMVWALGEIIQRMATPREKE